MVTTASSHLIIQLPLPVVTLTKNICCEQSFKDMSQRVDKALALYFKQLGFENYYDINGDGLFIQYINEERINDDEHIEQELGRNGDINDCLYTTFNKDISFFGKFPIPSYCRIKDNDAKKEFIFYTMQYCYQHGQPPNEQCMFT